MSVKDAPVPPVNPWPQYKRLFRYASRYRGHLLMGVLAGAVCGGSLFPMLQIFSPVLGMIDQKPVAVAPAVVTAAVPGNAPGFAQSVGAAEKIPGWQREVQKWSDRFHVPFLRADGCLTWQAILLGMLLVPLVVGARVLAMYMNQYCLRWLGVRVVRDLRDDLFLAMESQSLKYHGRVDVGRLISRNIADTGIIDMVINSAVAEASRAPFEIVGALLFVEKLDAGKTAGEFMSPALFLDDSTRLEIALRRMQRAGQRLAIVLARDGGETGVVSLEDILKLMFGEVKL